MEIEEYIQKYKNKSKQEIYTIITQNYSVELIHNLTTIAVKDSDVYESIINSIRDVNPDLCKQVHHEVMCNLGGIS